MQLLGEEVDTEEAVLAGGLAGRDLDDLARATLEDNDVTVADVVGWDGDSVWVSTSRSRRTDRGRGGRVDVDVDVWGGVVGAVHYAVGSLVESVAERVVVSYEVLLV